MGILFIQVTVLCFSTWLIVWLMDRKIETFSNIVLDNISTQSIRFFLSKRDQKLYGEAFPDIAYDGSSAGFDIRANHNATIQPGERELIKTGLFTEIPKGYEVQIRPRSGLALKQGLTVLNSPGTIDSDYRGEWGVILHNTSTEPYYVKRGDKVAQAVPKRNFGFQWEIVESAEALSETERGEGGFGSTGV